MKADLRAELVLVNRNVYEIICLLQCVTDVGDAGLWTRQEAAQHEARVTSRHCECGVRRMDLCE
jgi:hypothetical protein